MIDDLLVSGLEKLGLVPAPDRVHKFRVLYRSLVRWNRVVNLTAVDDENGFITVHVLDSLAIHPYLQGSSILDAGTGAGFPGLPLAIFFPECRFVLLDSVAKKIRFVRQMVIELGLPNVEAVHARVEYYASGPGFDTIVTRAFAGAVHGFARCRHLLAPGGKFLAMQGRLPEMESKLADGSHRIVPLRVPGLEAERHLIEITPCKYP